MFYSRRNYLSRIGRNYNSPYFANSPYGEVVDVVVLTRLALRDTNDSVLRDNADEVLTVPQ